MFGWFCAWLTIARKIIAVFWLCCALVTTSTTVSNTNAHKHSPFSLFTNLLREASLARNRCQYIRLILVEMSYYGVKLESCVCMRVYVYTWFGCMCYFILLVNLKDLSYIFVQLWCHHFAISALNQIQSDHRNEILFCPISTLLQATNSNGHCWIKINSVPLNPLTYMPY